MRKVIVALVATCLLGVVASAKIISPNPSYGQKERVVDIPATGKIKTPVQSTSTFPVHDEKGCSGTRTVQYQCTQIDSYVDGVVVKTEVIDCRKVSDETIWICDNPIRQIMRNVGIMWF